MSTRVWIDKVYSLNHDQLEHELSRVEFDQFRHLVVERLLSR